MNSIKSIKTICLNLVLIIAGSVICAAAIKGILVPKQFLAGGLTGLALIVYYVLPILPLGVMYFLLNIPLFVVGWLFVGRRFFLYSIAGVFIFSGAMLLPFPIIQIQDMLLAALTAGIITGVGGGIILKSLGSAGGLDILSVVLYKKFSVRPGTFTLMFNAILMGTAALRLPLEMILYTLIYLYVTSHFFNLVLVGLNQRKSIMIISQRWRDISGEIMEHLHRGVTIVRGEGGYSGQELHILYSVITFTLMYLLGLRPTSVEVLRI